MSDERPPIWTGHLGPIRLPDIDAAAAFYQKLGLRLAHHLEGTAIMEMRGGTHLVVVEGDSSPGDLTFDFMVEDLDASHESMKSKGVEVTEIEDLRVHRRFYVIDPGGHRIAVHDSHVVGTV